MAKTWVTDWPRHRLTAIAKRWVTDGCAEIGRRDPDLCISAPGRRAARMPGTGPQRRSSAPARTKALVRKSRFRAAALRSPRLSFFPPDVPDHKRLCLWALALELFLRA